MKKLPIDLDELISEATWNHAESAPVCLLDTQTGRLLIIERELWVALEDGEEPEFDPEEVEVAQAVFREPSRYESLPELESHESFGFMEDFAREKAQGKAQEALMQALGRGKPFRRFKDALTEFPSVREQWFAYEAERQRQWIQRWLAGLGLESTADGQAGSEVGPSRVQQWREVARDFHRVSHHLFRGNLPADFEPGDLKRLSARVPLSGAEEGVIAFLVHIWDHRENPFELSQVNNWDEEHLASFGRWVSDPEEPCRYF